jgi:hypothetical protein
MRSRSPRQRERSRSFSVSERGSDQIKLGFPAPLPCRRETHFFAIEWSNRARDEYKLSYMIVTARTLERVLLVTRSHLRFVRRHLD